MSDVKISVIIPVYKVKEEYLRDCLHSVLHQSLKEIEILLVDDGAPGDLFQVLAHYDSLDPRIRLLRQQHAGVSAARNTGIKASKGKYVTFVDSDDHIAEDNLEKAFSFAEKNELEIAIWGIYRCYEDRREQYMPFLETIALVNEKQKRDLMLKTMVGELPVYDKKCTACGSGACCAKLYLRSFLEKESLFYPVGMLRSEDVNFNIRAFDRADRIGYLHKFFYFYRQVSDSASYRYREDGIRVFEEALRGLKEFLDRTKKPELFYQAYYMRCIFFFLESMDMDYMNPENDRPLKERLHQMKEKMQEEPFAGAVKHVDGNLLSLPKRVPVFLMKHKMPALLALFYRIYRKMK